MEATGFGVMHVDDHDRIVTFLEKPADPPGIPDKPHLALASMGIYVFETRFLFDLLERDAGNAESSNDFGRDLIPLIVREGKAVAHRFSASCVKSSAEAEDYWRDVGTVDAYWESNIDLTAITPALNLYDNSVADLDLPGADRAGQVRPRRDEPTRHRHLVARVRRLHRVGHRAAAIAAVHRRANQLVDADRRGRDPAVRAGRAARPAAQGRRSIAAS